jgi:hypothetical protein
MLAWSAFAVAVALTLGALAFLILNRSTPGVSNFGSRVGDAAFGVALLAFPTVGALVASRRPENRIGWILAGVGLLLGIAAFANEYAVYALLTEPGSLPAGETMAWIGSWLFLAPLILTGTLLFLLFPDGRLASRRWRVVLWIAMVALVLALLGEMFVSGELQDFPSVENPYQAEGTFADVLEVTSNIAFLAMFGSIFASATSLFLRFRRSQGLERQQLKWVAASAGLLAAAFASGPIVLWYVAETAYEVFIILAIATIPVAAGIAILRYRLYEIDRIVNRAVVYGAVSALLAGAYFGIVLALQEVFSSLGGGSDLAIAVSTLAVAALFRPVRSRIQRLVDRRFYRRRYDAQRTLEAFSARLRDEIDLEALDGELAGVVSRTMQPAHVSVWLRPAVTDTVTPAGRNGGTTGGER